MPASWTKCRSFARSRSTGLTCAMLDDVPAFAEVPDGEAQLGGKDIHRAERQQAQRGAGAGDAVDHLVDRTVAASGDDALASLRDGLLRQGAGLAGAVGDADVSARGEMLDLAAKCAGALTAGGGIDDDEDGGHGRIAGSIAASSFRAAVPLLFSRCAKVAQGISRRSRRHSGPGGGRCAGHQSLRADPPGRKNGSSMP